ncbi:MAG: J domain-containing protein [Bacteroidota bacterium]|jgi:ElaB/YqjD/DUF883 family membrane-anchored ribosome-binding protein
MSLSRKYALLGLDESASDQEVRRRYRTLAMRYHPDKNPSPEAAEKFIRITEAYESILDRRNEHSTRRKEPANQYEKERQHKERVMEARRRYQEQQRKEQLENERYYQNLINGKKWKIISLCATIGIILSIFIMLDLFLPMHSRKDRVAEYARDVYSGPRGKSISLIRTEDDQFLWIEDLNFSLYAYYPDIYVERSWIFHDPVQVVSIQKTGFAFFPVHYTFRSVSLVMILCFLLPVFTVWYKRRTITFTLLWHLCLYLCAPLMLIFLLVNNHWAHLITLGFL